MSYVFDNMAVAVLVGVGIVVGRGMRRSPHWRVAFAEVARRRGARMSAYVVAAYAGIALLDSVGWHPAVRDESGAVMRDAAGRLVRDARGLTALDVLLTPWRTAREKTYSAPFAARQFTADYVRRDDGVLERTYPPLRYPRRHPLGTDRIGEDVFYQALKGVRTGMLLGVFTTVIVVPFALLFGLLAGYFGGWVDDVVQYLYTVLASIPAVLLVIAFMVLFRRGLTQLCVILGVTTWTGLCRVLRGETMKLRESEFVAAARAMCAPPLRILWRHIVPNVMHLVVITAVLGFSGRVLSEAALTYMGIGVGVDTYSWGRMINDARLELARDPVVWWKLAAAFMAMVGLVLPANVLGDALRDALDPRLRSEPS